MSRAHSLLVGLVLLAGLAGCATAPTEPSAPTAHFARPTVAGALNSDVTQETIHQTICVPGYTKTIRPPVSYTDAIKRRLMQEQPLAGRAQDYELDHLIPIEGGGHPRSPDNLWMQPLTEARVKDVDENRMHRAICNGRMTLRAAQAALLLQWGPTAP